MLWKLSDPLLRMEFEDFSNLKTKKEREIFQQKRRSAVAHGYKAKALALNAGGCY